ncbi:MAG: cell division protein FtsZ [Clostridia bacterium]|nr:cell division protein FtsZ [Clostridia bacterium]
MQNIENTIKIKVIGIGGGGNNAAIRILGENVQNIDTYLLNTEISKLKNINPKNVLQIGKQTTKGLGAGANERIGEASAIESSEQIKQMLQGTDMLFLTAGMGGGTGTGAIPVVANIAKSMGILTVAIVTKPFAFEGKQRLARAEVGIDKLKQNVNALIVVLNDRLLKISKEKLLINKAFELADNVLEQGIHGIIDLITTVGDINIDFADIQTIFGYKGKAYMGIGIAKEGDNLEDAVKQAVENPLTENKIDNAKGVIFNIRGGENLGLNEINTVMKIINDKVCEDANIMFGTVIDETLGNKKIVTVIATGIE